MKKTKKSKKKMLLIFGAILVPIAIGTSIYFVVKNNSKNNHTENELHEILNPDGQKTQIKSKFTLEDVVKDTFKTDLLDKFNEQYKEVINKNSFIFDISNNSDIVVDWTTGEGIAKIKEKSVFELSIDVLFKCETLDDYIDPSIVNIGEHDLSGKTIDQMKEIILSSDELNIKDDKEKLEFLSKNLILTENDLKEDETFSNLSGHKFVANFKLNTIINPQIKTLKFYTLNGQNFEVKNKQTKIINKTGKKDSEIGLLVKNQNELTFAESITGSPIEIDDNTVLLSNAHYIYLIDARTNDFIIKDSFSIQAYPEIKNSEFRSVLKTVQGTIVFATSNELFKLKVKQNNSGIIFSNEFEKISLPKLDGGYENYNLLINSLIQTNDKAKTILVSGNLYSGDSQSVIRYHLPMSQQTDGTFLFQSNFMDKDSKSLINVNFFNQNGNQYILFSTINEKKLEFYSQQVNKTDIGFFAQSPAKNSFSPTETNIAVNHFTHLEIEQKDDQNTYYSIVFASESNNNFSSSKFSRQQLNSVSDSSKNDYSEIDSLKDILIYQTLQLKNGKILTFNYDSDKNTTVNVISSFKELIS